MAEVTGPQVAEKLCDVLSVIEMSAAVQAYMIREHVANGALFEVDMLIPDLSRLAEGAVWALERIREGRYADAAHALGLLELPDDGKEE